MSNKKNNKQKKKKMKMKGKGKNPELKILKCVKALNKTLGIIGIIVVIYLNPDILEKQATLNFLFSILLHLMK